MKKMLWQIDFKKSPILATAIHNGHYIDPSILEYMKISSKQRLREEDPYTEEFIKFFENKIVVYRSRFQIDLNRPIEKAIYKKPEDAWGLEIYKQLPPKELLEKSYMIYNMFYKEVDFLINSMLDFFKNIVVLDIHSYNYRRKSPYIEEPKSQNPDINLGTKTIKRKKKWQKLIDRVIEEFKKRKIDDINIDIRENVKFKGGYFPYWIHNRFDHRVCVLSIEFKKIFMDEWTGKAYFEKINKIAEILKEIKIPILEELEKLEKR
ncbi:N-formylglutamate amidohydrolase [Nitrosophilus kaiyonis]|uniref:N-formylglutamate amidohydrolase n=1 Tax=Nitrosophilus kaiyonis TaxID=2930200 RepID=UPI0024907150|nr:N-formylglutamate amidohydrolase [Nitrosophilus kaiyonis]